MTDEAQHQNTFVHQFADPSTIACCGRAYLGPAAPDNLAFTP